MSISLKIRHRFCGPPNSANGGYAAGLIAKNAPFQAEVTLRKPPPLDQPLQLFTNEKTATLKDGERLIAEAKAADFQLEILKAVDKKAILAAEDLVANGQMTAFQHCFVCGKNRGVGDGLRIYPRNVGPQQVACIWKPHKTLGDAKGFVETEYLWAALDCPGIWAIQDATQLYLLGRIAAKTVKRVTTNQEYIVMGWVIEIEGRKLKAGTAIYEPSGEVCAYAKSTWIKLNQ